MFPAKRALFPAGDGGDDSGLPEQDPGGGRPRHHLQRPQGLRVVCIVLRGNYQHIQGPQGRTTDQEALKLLCENEKLLQSDKETLLQ